MPFSDYIPSKKTTLVAGGAAVGFVGVPLLVAGGLYVVGFTSTGVVASSLAAGWQGSAVAAGGWFATSQSVAAAGLATGTKVALGVGGAAIGNAIKDKV